ncbi:type VI secretion system baseplate subunit TssG [Budviciaceae bacterium BWR-B9]|uniref:Type VI secretion system baseplate subunit TssG n=1 Tax=Limnobaculum allomyrinae TaxID=2791986 RepID=A0ABS1IKD5_9GAMM|nr:MULTISPECIES: type VI secretion system baseplate subunit TssG [Limnobaculum]MBK5142208.1 type VI secretion system baseplate subunit TssG [Limnobaculum allomyrinae]MBV7690908.1 type VI secretion system baseplate subunit TssG [Limnobaculum sp. M2-1]
MDRQQDSTFSPLMEGLFRQVPRMNFYKFCQYIEQQHPDLPPLGKTETPATDPIRFRPVPEMGFPASEMKRVEWDREYPERPPTVRTTFLGLYGVDAVLPYAWLDDIVQRQEGHESLEGFLDIFNHRVMTQYYRIWLKYYYPAGFRSGGTDLVSQCLLGLAGFGIEGSSEQIAAPPSRFLALMGLITQRTRTGDGLRCVVNLLLPGAEVEVREFYPQWINLESPARLQRDEPISLQRSAVLGRRFKESNSAVHVTITPVDIHQVEGLLPGESIHTDLMALLRAYLGYRFDACMNMKVKRSLLPKAQLGESRVRLGLTAVLGIKQRDKQHQAITVNLGRYVGLAAGQQ